MQQVVSRPRHLAGAITPPGDKSISHRAAIFNAIAEGRATVRNFCPGEDGASTLRVLREAGARIEQDGLSLSITGGPLREPSDVLDVGNSGTTIRLMSGVMAGQPFMSVLSGDQSLRSRPMDRIATPLRLMGAQVLGRDGGNLAPLAVRGGNLRGIRYKMPVASAQLKSAILLAALFAEGETVVDQPALSRDHTELMFRAMGVPVHEDGLTLQLRAGGLRAMDVTGPADISSAAFWLVAGVCHPDAEVRVKGVGVNPSRTGVLDVLREMGADITVQNQRTEGGELVGDLVARSSKLEAIEIGGDMIPRLIDEIPVLALAACFARGVTVVRDAQELRVKESDRIKTTGEGLSRLGGRVEELPDGLRVTGTGRLAGAATRSHGDHRIAMTLGIAGLLADGSTTIQDAEVAAVSYPSFWSDLRDLAPEGARV